MSTTPMSSTATDHGSYGTQPVRRATTETKSAFKTTEFIVYVAVVVAVLIASLVTDAGADGQGFDAKTAWLLVTLLTIGYMISRGLAKSGSRERYDA
ncbi:MAG TPA: hypothetical protein VFP34_13030 [Microlunatus sp.]|nr:hypothetical protein [Microlunatus sp.]